METQELTADTRTQRLDRMIQAEATSKQSTIMQYPNELAFFAGFCIDHGVRSYLEVGIQHGGLLAFMETACQFETVAGVSYEERETLRSRRADHPNWAVFIGDSHSLEYRAWRAGLGQIDLVMIDGDHSYAGVKADYELELSMPSRYIAFHDIANKACGVPRLWNEIPDDRKLGSFTNGDPAVRMLITIRDRNSEDFYSRHIEKHGIGAGIGIVRGSLAAA